MEKFYDNEAMVGWMAYFADLMNVSPEKIKMMNICGKEKNVIPSIDTHKRMLIFTDDSHPDLFYSFWEAGFGDYQMWYGTGRTPEKITACKVADLMDTKVTEPMVIFIVNENTRESARFGIQNDNFSKGPIRYVGKEIRAVIMSMLGVDSHDSICIISGESIVIEAAIAASDGTIIAVETDPGSKRSMEENVEKFGVYNVKIVTDVTEDQMAGLPAPRLAFIVASKNTESQIVNLLKQNPHMQFIIYTLELDTLAAIKGIFEKYGIARTETLQISVSKTDAKSVFVAQPAPWMVSGEA